MTHHTMQTPRASLAEIADKLEIHELFGRYALSIDAYDSAGWASCFAPDGAFVIDGGSGGEQYAFEGREALVAFADAHARLFPGTRHMQCDHVTEIDGDTAYDRCTKTGHVTRPDRVYTFSAGWYETWLRRVDERWRITKRVVHNDNFDPEQFRTGEVGQLFGELNRWVTANASRIVG